ncbi:hypothetical protein BUALT_Bualt03G0053900 [Buddleja alternifolia]|uniref:Uncharacterized protein n=1 Tax=Buddleja alternifolia TaxID=168488 RepID=A0AAV6XR72_9LAMI|nr:hypothetical protein BUALT_Bualt03G0053900 [Buddleja alternifolia]
MDSDFWTARLAAAKRQFNMQQHHRQLNGGSRANSQLDRFIIDDLEVEEEIRPDFPCPYCCEEFDIASLCSHLDDEHSYESTATVCPICSINVARDMLSHITLQHGHLLKISFSVELSHHLYFLVKRRRRLHRVPMPNSQALSLLGKDLREAHLQVLLGGAGLRSNNATSSSSSSNAPTDPFLSSLFLNFSASDADEISKSVLSSIEENSSKSVASRHLWNSSFLSSLSREEREQRMRQEAERTVFVQDLLYSTLLAD